MVFLFFRIRFELGDYISRKMDPLQVYSLSNNFYDYEFSKITLYNAIKFLYTG